MPTLWINDNGRICCEDHLGHYAETTLAARPTAKVLRTPLGTWLKVSEPMRLEMAAEFAADGLTFGCETCEYEVAR